MRSYPYPDSSGSSYMAMVSPGEYVTCWENLTQSRLTQKVKGSSAPRVLPAQTSIK